MRIFIALTFLFAMAAGGNQAAAAPRLTREGAASTEASRWSVVASERVNTNFQGEAVAPDGAVWTVDYHFSTLDRFTSAGGHEQFPIHHFYPSGIALGAGGDLWINENGGAARLARATQHGAITFFNLPELQFAYGGLVAGPDNSVWFTEQTAIGRMTPRGSVTQFPSNGCSTAANGIAVGSDGRLWYGAACPGSPNVVFALDPATGRQVSYPISSLLRLAAAGIVAGPDGALWFTSAQNGGHLGRITTAGSITAYKVLPGQFPAFSVSAQNIAVGPDRRIWFIQDLGTSSVVGSIDPLTLEVTLHVPPRTFGRMFSITTGRDGRMWMTAGNQIYTYRVL